MSVQQDTATGLFYYTQPSGNRSVALYATAERAEEEYLEALKTYKQIEEDFYKQIVKAFYNIYDRNTVVTILKGRAENIPSGCYMTKFDSNSTFEDIKTEIGIK